MAGSDLHVHGQIELVVMRTVHFAQIVDGAQIGFANEDAYGPGSDRPPGAVRGKHVVNFGQIGRSCCCHLFIAIDIDLRLAVGAEDIRSRPVSEGSSKSAVMASMTEPGRTVLDPEALDVVHGFANLGVAPVEVGLLDVEAVVVVLLAHGIPLPRGMAEDGEPVVGRLAMAATHLRVAPHVPVGFPNWWRELADSLNQGACRKYGSAPDP